MAEFTPKFADPKSNLVDVLNRNLRDIERAMGAQKSGRQPGMASAVPGSSVSSHQQLSGRDLLDSHPIEAIAGLVDALNDATPRVYQQSVAATTWGPFANPFGRPCGVEIVDSTGSEFDAEVSHASDWSTVTILLKNAMSGHVVLT